MITTISKWSFSFSFSFFISGYDHYDAAELFWRYGGGAG
jgi:hypothetical protein